MKSTPILINYFWADGKRIDLKRKTNFCVLEQLRQMLKEKYKAKNVYFNYRERIK